MQWFRQHGNAVLQFLTYLLTRFQVVYWMVGWWLVGWRLVVLHSQQNAPHLSFPKLHFWFYTKINLQHHKPLLILWRMMLSVISFLPASSWSCRTGCSHRRWEQTTAQGSCSSTGGIITICLTPLTSHTPDLHTQSSSFHCRSHEEAFWSHYLLLCSSRASWTTNMKYVTAWAAHSHAPSLGIFQIHSDMKIIKIFAANIWQTQISFPSLPPFLPGYRMVSATAHYQVVMAFPKSNRNIWNFREHTDHSLPWVGITRFDAFFLMYGCTVKTTIFPIHFL